MPEPVHECLLMVSLSIMKTPLICAWSLFWQLQIYYRPLDIYTLSLSVRSNHIQLYTQYIYNRMKALIYTLLRRINAPIVRACPKYDGNDGLLCPHFHQKAHSFAVALNNLAGAATHMGWWVTTAQYLPRLVTRDYDVSHRRRQI